MDLRPYIKSEAQLEQGIQLIRDKLLFYQPYILADNVEIGEGMNHCNRYEGVEAVFDLNVYAKDRDVGERKQPSDLQWFRRCNQEYREIYQYVCDQICGHADDDIRKLTFAEIGCNTGLNLFNLAVRGAGECHGYDWTNVTPVFNWLNGVLGTRVSFTQGSYSNLKHTFTGTEVSEADIMINTIFLNHQCDPLQFLCFLCDRARKGVFLWVLMAEHSLDSKDCYIRYPSVQSHAIMDAGRAFPLCFYNEVRLSEGLLKLALNELGFEEVHAIPMFIPSQRWGYFQQGFRMYYAKRTKSRRSAYWSSTRESSDYSLQQSSTSPTAFNSGSSFSFPELQRRLFHSALWRRVLRPVKKALISDRKQG